MSVLKQKLDKGEKVLVIDVRSDEEIKTGSIPGARMREPRPGLTALVSAPGVAANHCWH